jgi:hypothetical protein
MLSLVVISQMVDSGAQMGLRAQLVTRAALQCEAKMEEIVAGAQPLQSTSGLTPLEGLGQYWMYQVVVEPESWSSAQASGQSVTGLNTVHVTVVWDGPGAGGRVEYTLSRLVMDPRLRVPEPRPVTQSSNSSGSTSGSGTGSTPGTSGGGQTK